VRVYIAPSFARDDQGDGGIRRCVDAQRKFLPTFGIEVVDHPMKADVVNLHAGNRADYLPDVPMVASSHGLYWAEYVWPSSYQTVNEVLTENLIRAQVITAPSKWVARAIARGMLRDPEVIYHGVDNNLWEPGENEGYVLYNKARADSVSNPDDVLNLMKQRDATAWAGTFRVVSTMPVEHIDAKVIGRMSYDNMRKWVQNAGVYLSTARETFGIGTLEALSSGVPIAGWDYGGNSEIVVDGETGYLAPYGDYEALVDCIRRCLAERERLSPNCRADAQERWQWKDKIGQYAKIFARVYNESTTPRPKVSVVVPACNLAHFLPDTLVSILGQTMTDWECVIVDDSSDDNTPQVGREWEESDGRFRYFRTPRNLKLCGTRNFGVDKARGRYIMFLDADDMLPPATLATLSSKLDSNPSLHIAYGHMDMINEQGEDYQRNSWPYDNYTWYGQMAHLNQMPYNALVKSEVYAWAGGHRERHERAEDAWYWAYATSYGFRAEKVTNASCLLYRLRSGSKSKGEGWDGLWTDEFPWKIARSAEEAEAWFKRFGRLDLPHPGLVPWGAQGSPPEGMFWNVHHRNDPEMVVVVDCSDASDREVIDTLDSIQLQSWGNWDCYVCWWNTPSRSKPLPGYTWAQWVGDQYKISARARGLTVKAGNILGQDDLLALTKHLPNTL